MDSFHKVKKSFKLNQKDFIFKFPKVYRWLSLWIHNCNGHALKWGLLLLLAETILCHDYSYLKGSWGSLLDKRIYMALINTEQNRISKDNYESQIWLHIIVFLTEECFNLATTIKTEWWITVWMFVILEHSPLFYFVRVNTGFLVTSLFLLWNAHCHLWDLL